MRVPTYRKFPLSVREDEITFLVIALDYGVRLSLAHFVRRILVNCLSIHFKYPQLSRRIYWLYALCSTRPTSKTLVWLSCRLVLG